MTIATVILIPKHGSHHRQFYWVAQYLNNNLYKRKAMIVLAEFKVDENKVVQTHLVSSDRGVPFSFSQYQRISTLIVISHSGKLDGPIMGMDVGSLNVNGQPWSRANSLDKTHPYTAGGRFVIDFMKPDGLNFWRMVGNAVRSEGKIILLGCNSGAEQFIYAPGGEHGRSLPFRSYAERVAGITRRTTYGADGGIAAADIHVVARLVGAIEENRKPVIDTGAERLIRFDFSSKGVIRRGP